MKSLNKQLWYKALDRAVPETYTHLSPDQLGKAIDVYTELVVQECSKVNNQYVGWRIGDIDLDVVYKEHFGVEE